MDPGWLRIVSVVVLAWALPCQAADPAEPRVLYAGHLGSVRAEEFTTFLRQHFSKVGQADYEQFKESDARSFDVVLLDWSSMYPRDAAGKPLANFTDLKTPKRPRLSESYGRPTILIGAAGGLVARPLQLKIDWLCLCLDEAAHGLASSHEVFRTPFPVDLTYEDHAVPVGYRHYPGGDTLGKTIKVWKVQTRTYPEIDPGLVADPYGFEDSPDAEVIASGLNGKGPLSVALGRQGNFFHWGFAGSPSDMTPEGRKCFLNAIWYIRKFDGQTPLVHRRRQAREWALILANELKRHPDDDELSRLFPQGVQERFRNDPAGLLSYFKENFEYLYPAGETFMVDDDAKVLGLSNRSVEILDRCVAMLAAGDRPELARGLLKRYTEKDFATPREWRSWLEANRGLLYFTDAGGFRFLAGPEASRRLPRVADPVRPDPRNPLYAQAQLSRARVVAGEAVSLVITLRVDPGWHIYAAGQTKGPGIPTSLTLSLPEGIEAEGAWIHPEAVPAPDGQKIHEGTVEFRRTLRVNANASPGAVRLTCRFGYQACNTFSCRPPSEVELTAEAEVVANDQKNRRTEDRRLPGPDCRTFPAGLERPVRTTNDPLRAMYASSAGQDDPSHASRSDKLEGKLIFPDATGLRVGSEKESDALTR